MPTAIYNYLASGGKRQSVLVACSRGLFGKGMLSEVVNGKAKLSLAGALALHAASDGEIALKDMPLADRDRRALEILDEYYEPRHRRLSR